MKRSKTETQGRQPVTEYVLPEKALAQMGDGMSVLFEAKKEPRRTLLPDPSELQEFGTAAMLSEANAFAAQYDVNHYLTVQIPESDISDAQGG